MTELWNLIYFGEVEKAMDAIEILTYYESPIQIDNAINHVAVLDDVGPQTIECSCLQLSLLNEMPEITLLLLESNANPNLQTNDGFILPPLEIASMCAPPNIVRKLLEFGARPNQSSLTLAFKRRDYKSMIYLVAYGCEENVRLKTLVNIYDLRCVALMKEARRFKRLMKRIENMLKVPNNIADTIFSYLFVGRKNVLKLAY